MMHLGQFHRCVVRPTLNSIEMGGIDAERLLIGTALIESGLKYLQQIGGPACGVYQCEPATHDDIWRNFLVYRKDVRDKIIKTMCREIDPIDQLRGNMIYATAMCRVHYLRVPDPLPHPDDAHGLALYHKKHYNTMKGKTDPAESQKVFDMVIGEIR